LEQPFVKNPDVSVQKYIDEKSAAFGQKLGIKKIARFERGEGIEKKEENFAEEVMKQVNG